MPVHDSQPTIGREEATSGTASTLTPRVRRPLPSASARDASGDRRRPHMRKICGMDVGSAARLAPLCAVQPAGGRSAPRRAVVM